MKTLILFFVLASSVFADEKLYDVTKANYLNIRVLLTVQKDIKKSCDIVGEGPKHDPNGKYCTYLVDGFIYNKCHIYVEEKTTMRILGNALFDCMFRAKK